MNKDFRDKMKNTVKCAKWIGEFLNKTINQERFSRV